MNRGYLDIMSNLATACLDDKYTIEKGVVFLTGIQALVRLPMVQRQRDVAGGLNTAAFISGYRGSPLGGFDQALWQARPFLERHHIVFEPGVNEDLAATAIWGSQQVNLFPDAKVDGVFGMWYGKGPGVDRSGDVFKHANAAGTAPFGGVLALAGDDHTCKSSTLPHQSEYAFIDAGIPVLNPSGIQEILDFGILGWEMSRYSGCWVALKTIAETMDSSATVQVDPDRCNVVLPPNFEMLDGGPHIRWPDPPMEQEYRLHGYKIYAALAFARANRLNRVVMDSERPRLGIVTTGKSYLDVLQALDDLGIDQELAGEIGLRVYKVGMPWPLEREGARQFAEGLDEVLVVEEKRAIIENQLKEQLYNWRSDVRPRVVGKFDQQRRWILPSNGELTPARIARVIAERIAPFYRSERIEQRLAFLEQKELALERINIGVQRTPHFCSGCPHNTSTKVPEGSRAMAGIGCHYMANWMDRSTETFTQMGGEGATWIGQSPFTETRHVFANLGDGTYFHSGLLAIRASIAAGVNITYKLLFNDAVAMTGGQPVGGSLSVPRIAHQLAGEGASRIAIVSENPAAYRKTGDLPVGVEVFYRDELPLLQLKFREIEGVSVIIYDQVCAAEKRRRRKRGLMEDPPKRVIINSDVCEGCGDCGVQSNCLSVIPVETPLGRKRAIDQSACNKDFSCLKGFCPSFVVVHGGNLKRARVQSTSFPKAVLPDPRLPVLERPYRILITGVGGTGVVTVSALLGMAAHLDQRGASVLDMTGLAQKYGAVTSHVQITAGVGEVKAARIAAGGADLLLGCDSVVAAGFDAQSKIEAGQTTLVVNNHQSSTAQFLTQPDLGFPAEQIEKVLEHAAGTGRADFFDATVIAERLLGNTIGGNLMLIGYAWQKGLIPISRDAIERAIELNGTAVEFNKKAFELGRHMAHDPKPVLHAAGLMEAPDQSPQQTSQALGETIEYRKELLVQYQDAACAERFAALVAKVESAEASRAAGKTGMASLVAKRYFALLAYKDEYEVARLLSSDKFKQEIQDQFEGDYRLEYQLAPPVFSRIDEVSGRPQKRAFGPWILNPLKLLAAMRRLRGTKFDLFGYQQDRREERSLIEEYEASVDAAIELLIRENHEDVLMLLDWPREIRGFGPVKRANIERARRSRAQWLERLRNSRQVSDAA